ncbi:Pycsar system effector family protein [Sphingosinicella terrae]|uniref:Pycsar system effector family protein n=1 Tax=Sphingosinicella terrae TaxID=2172047 RepID=UPI000E0D2E23|nr:Pycsar system effector family protein [Sphingosinicella terrae]
MAEEKNPVPPHYPANAVHLMRTTQLAQLQLSAMADTKANIVMGATFVIFTITIGKAQGASAPLPLLILGAAAFFSAIFAILAVLPVTRGRRSASEPNLLFFGVFTRIKEEEFIDRLMTRLESDDSVYRTMARDIHQQGTVLQTKKYRMLNYAYRTLLLGLVASGIAYLVLYFTEG